MKIAKLKEREKIVFSFGWLGSSCKSFLINCKPSVTAEIQAGMKQLIAVSSRSHIFEEAMAAFLLATYFKAGYIITLDGKLFVFF